MLARCSRNSWPAAVRNEPTLRSWHRRRAIHCHHATCGRCATGSQSGLEDARPAAEGFVNACALTEIPEKCATVVSLNGERVAIFKYDGKISAISNVCRHQNGPLGEGKIIDGCVTCPWHGYQYLPEDGASPPPFTEKVCTFQTRIVDGRVWIDPDRNRPALASSPR